MMLSLKYLNNFIQFINIDFIIIILCGLYLYLPKHHNIQCPKPILLRIHLDPQKYSGFVNLYTVRNLFATSGINAIYVTQFCFYLEIV